MKKLLIILIITMLLTILLFIERSFGLPLLFLMGVLFFNTYIDERYEMWIGLWWGIILAVVFGIPIWLGIVSIGGGLWLFSYLVRVVASNLRRASIVVAIQSILLSMLLWGQMRLGWFFILYHLGVVVMIGLVMFVGRVRQYRVQTISFSKRMKYD